MDDRALTPNITSLIFEDGDPPPADDPAEGYIEASKLHRRLSNVEVPGIYLLESSPWLVEATSRGGRALEHRPSIQLPEPLPTAGDDRLGELLRTRRSPDRFSGGPAPTLEELSRWCHQTAGATATIGGLYEGRPYPSGGGLRPCDLFVSLDETPDVPGGTYHYNAARHALEHYCDATPERYGATTPQPETFDGVSAVWIVVCAVWRSRFKYAQRSLRFSLLEAGHMAQNIVLSVMPDGHGGRPIGGYFDDEVADLLQVDGVHEFPVYMVVTGRPAATHPTTEEDAA